MYIDAKWIEKAAEQSPEAVRPEILYVDDDPCALDGLQRQLKSKFRIHIANGGSQGLEMNAKNGPFAVVIADLQMPGTDGVEFVTKVGSASPDSVLVVLAERGDIAAAKTAVNQSNIFRFLVKPSTPLVIEMVLRAALEQHRLLTAEREVTHATLLGCVELLVEVLRIVQPAAFYRSVRLLRLVREMAAVMELKGYWQLEAAAMLSQLGCITLQPNLRIKADVGESMSDEEHAVFVGHGSAAARLLEKIPRLRQVARMVESQHVEGKALAFERDGSAPDLDDLMAEILRAAVDFDSLHQKGIHHTDVVNRMRQQTSDYLPQVMVGIGRAAARLEAAEVRFVTIGTLVPGLVLEESLRGQNGSVLLGRGEELTEAFIARLRSLGLPPGQKVRVRSSAANFLDFAADAYSMIPTPPKLAKSASPKGG